MHLYGALVLLVTVSAACGLRCYNCVGKTCTYQLTCPFSFDRCTSITVNDLVTKACMSTALCVGPIKCCSTDLCNGATPTGNVATPTGNVAIPTGNGAIPTGSSVLLLLASSAIITLFL